MNWNYYDLRKRFANFEYHHDTIHEGKPLADDFPNAIEVDYERPYFNPKNQETFGIISNFEDLMKNLGYSLEFEQFQNAMILKNLQPVDILNKIELFVDFRDVIIQKDIDGEIFQKIKKNPIKYENPKIFVKHSLSTLKQTTDESLCQKNIYGRNILYYVKDPDVLNYILQRNERFENHIDLFSIDVFNSSVLNFQRNIDCYKILLEKMIALSPDVTNLFFTKINSFGKNATVPLTDYFTRLKINSDDKNNDSILTSLKKGLEIVNLIKKIDAPLAFEINTILCDEKYIDIISNHQNNSAFHKKFKILMENEMILNSLDSFNQSAKNKKPKL